MIAKIGDWVKLHRRDLWIAVCVALVGWSSYNVGVIRGRSQSPKSALKATIYEETTPSIRSRAVPEQGNSTPTIRTDQRVVASKSSTSKKYHFTWCASANKIKEANKVWFATAREAEAAGYTLAGNCQP